MNGRHYNALLFVFEEHKKPTLLKSKDIPNYAVPIERVEVSPV